MLDILRKFYVEEIEKSQAREVRDFAQFLRERDKNGMSPCWGGAAAKAVRKFKSLRARTRLWEELLRIYEENALLLFIKLNLDREDVMKVVLSDAENLPIVVQRVLVAINEIDGMVVDNLLSFSQEVQDLYHANKEVKGRERERFETRAERLLAVKSCLPRAQAEDEPVGE